MSDPRIGVFEEKKTGGFFDIFSGRRADPGDDISEWYASRAREREAKRADGAYRLYGPPLNNLEPHGGGWVNEHGEILIEAPGDPLANPADPLNPLAVERRLDVAGWTRSSDGYVVFLKTAGRVADLDRQAAEQQQRETERQEAEQKWRRKQPKRAVTLADVDGVERVTLKHALRVIASVDGTIGIGRFGEIVVEVPARLTFPYTPAADNPTTDPFGEQALQRAVADATKAIVAAAPAMRHYLEHLKRGEQLCDVVPDLPISAGGGLA